MQVKSKSPNQRSPACFRRRPKPLFLQLRPHKSINRRPPPSRRTRRNLHLLQRRQRPPRRPIESRRRIVQSPARDPPVQQRHLVRSQRRPRLRHPRRSPAHRRNQPRRRCLHPCKRSQRHARRPTPGLVARPATLLQQRPHLPVKANSIRTRQNRRQPQKNGNSNHGPRIYQRRYCTLSQCGAYRPRSCSFCSATR